MNSGATGGASPRFGQRRAGAFHLTAVGETGNTGLHPKRIRRRQVRHVFATDPRGRQVSGRYPPGAFCAMPAFPPQPSLAAADGKAAQLRKLAHQSIFDC
ncbi:hypothetical protein SAMN05519105_0742 [Rhodobacter sp. 24-YEA-8]|nr:hypothetical protein SAMN05519105_0742 [Rhodobacter sp. 24-YEA-8]